MWNAKTARGLSYAKQCIVHYDTLVAQYTTYLLQFNLHVTLRLAWVNTLMLTILTINSAESIFMLEITLGTLNPHINDRNAASSDLLWKVCSLESVVYAHLYSSHSLLNRCPNEKEQFHFFMIEIWINFWAYLENTFY